MDKKPSENAEALGRKLQEKLKHERPRWLRWVPLIAVVLLGITATVAWLAYPEPELPPLTVTALDVLAADGETIVGRAHLDPAEPDAKAGSLAALEVMFSLDRALDVPVEAPMPRTGLSDANGLATVTLPRGGAAGATYLVRQTLVKRKQKAPEDRARIFELPKNTSLLLVDVEETLADLDPKLWTKTNPDDIAVRPGASAALQAATTQQKYTIVYLAVANAPAREYRRVRGWIGQPKTKVPEGPVLGRLRYDPAGVAEARQAVLADVRQRFTGMMVAVVRTSEAAEQCLALGIRAVAMGGGDFPAQVTRIKGWDELPAALAQ